MVRMYYKCVVFVDKIVRQKVTFLKQSDNTGLIGACSFKEARDQKIGLKILKYDLGKSLSKEM